MCLMKLNERHIGMIFGTPKEVQEVNIRDKLRQIKDNDIVVFTDWSALSHPGPSGGGAVRSWY